MKYRPLDLSFLQQKYNPQQQDIRNTAHMILANAGWGPSQVTMKEIAAAQKKAKEGSKHKLSPIGGLFDLLSTPLYTMTNALDQAIAGHQSDNNDSVLSDAENVVGGLISGGAKGFGAGLRGSTAFLDVLPGVDINDDWQADPTNKTHFSDINNRLTTHMSTDEALQHPEEALKNAHKEKAEVPSWLGDLFYGNIDTGSTQEDLKTLLTHTGIVGIGEDIGGDPLNYIPVGGQAKAAAELPKTIEAGLAAAKKVEGLDAIKSGLKSPLLNKLDEKGPLNLPTPVPVAPEISPGTAAAITHGPFELHKGVKNALGVGGRESSVPKAGFNIDTKTQKALAKQITELAVRGEKGWIYKAGELLSRHGNNWGHTEEFLQKIYNAVDKIGGKHNPRLGPVLAAHIAEDSKKTEEVRSAERILNEDPNVVVKPGDISWKGNKLKVGEEGAAPKLKRSEAQLANNVVRKFEAEVLGAKSAPGTGEGLVHAIASGRNARYSGPQQARMWNQITSRLKYSDPKKFDKAVRILRASEDYFIAKGAIPHGGTKLVESVPLRLSQVAEAIGPQFLGKSHAFITGILRGDPKALAQLSPEQIQSIEHLKASEALATAPAVQQGIKSGQEAAASITSQIKSQARMKEDLNKVVDFTRLQTARFGGGEVGARVAAEYMKNILGKTDPVNSALAGSRFKTEAWLSRNALNHGGSINDVQFARNVNNAISKAAQLPDLKRLGKLSAPLAHVTDWLGARFNAAYGVQDMRPTFLREQASAMSTTARRAKLLNALAKRFPPTEVDLWHEAFRATQKNGISSGQVAELQAELGRVMENLFGGTGLRSGAIADSTVIGRNRLYMAELNKNLRRFGLGAYEFTAKSKFKDADGVIHDFSKGTDWVKSWEAWKVTQPYEFLHKVQMAIEHTVREKNMFDEIVARFASPKKLGDVKFGVNHPRLHGYFFNEEGARQATQFVKLLDEVAQPNSKAMQHFDHVLSKLKASLTIYIPGHHFTNIIGDTYYNWIAGVNNPARYDQAMRTMLAQRGRYGDFASFDKLTGPKAVEQALARSLVGADAGLKISPLGNKVMIKMKNGTKVTADMIYTAAMREGILPSARVLEDVTSDVSSVLDKIKPLGGRGQKAVHQVSEIRDHIPRLAQFIDGLAKSSSNFTKASEVSAAAVRKWHPDGLDLTKFEKNIMKRVFPFYSWTRKAVPLAVESALLAAPKVMAYPRVMEAIAMINGVEAADGTTDPFPTDQLFPDWMRNRGIGPIKGGAGSYRILNPSTPVIDTFALMGQPGYSAIDMLNPMVKVPLEVSQDQTLGRKTPINNYLDYGVQQAPIASQLGAASGQVGVSDSTKQEGFPDYNKILNLLTGAKRVKTSKYQKSAQFDLRDYFKQKKEQQGR